MTLCRYLFICWYSSSLGKSSILKEKKLQFYAMHLHLSYRKKKKKSYKKTILGATNVQSQKKMLRTKDSSNI